MQCSAAAALGMAYFFVLQRQAAFDVQWCRGNSRQVIFDPWVDALKKQGVNFQMSTRVTGFELDGSNPRIKNTLCKTLDDQSSKFEAQNIIFAVSAEALNAIVRSRPILAQYQEFRRFADLRGTSVSATRLFLDRTIEVPYSANACWGFDEGVGMTFFDITTIHGPHNPTVRGAPGTVLEVDYYQASSLLVMDDDSVTKKVKDDMDTILGCSTSKVTDAAIVRLPNAVKWNCPGSFVNLPKSSSKGLQNVYYAGDLV